MTQQQEHRLLSTLSAVRARFNRLDGGPGSGNWGHAGRKEQRGGSAPGGGKEHRAELPGGGYTAKRRTGSGKPPRYIHRESPGERDALADESAAEYYLYRRTGQLPPEGTCVKAVRARLDQERKEAEARFRACSPAQQRLMNMSMDELLDFQYSCDEMEIDPELNTKSLAQKAVCALGMHTPPKVVGEAEFRRAAERSPGVMYRGVADSAARNVTADGIVDLTLRGKQNFLGNGIYGDGIYFTTAEKEARIYATGKKGRVMTACLSDQARVADFDLLSEDRMDDDIARDIPDISIYALHKGYNVIRKRISEAEDYYAVLDREALVFRKPE